ncbi:MAG: hypothetical protein Q8Q59_02955 [Luteolibacter sp.]|jgi:hypothetical protein|nr:hypothetical protein [Luteolibacter sp.]
MDRELSEQAEIQQLIRLAEVSRSCLGNEAAALKRRFDVPSKIRESLSGHPTSWLFGSLASGLAASLMFRRRPAPAVAKKSSGMIGMLLGVGLTAARPLLKVWLTNQVGRWLAAHSSNAHDGRPTPRPLSKSQSL